MTRDKGKKGSTVIPEGSLTEKLSKKPSLDTGIQSRIGDQLRAMYDDLVHQPVPDKLTALLAKLDRPDEGNGR